MFSMINRAKRRFDRKRITVKWLRRIKSKWRRHRSVELLLEAVKRVDTHKNIRNHCRRSCSYCNPLFRRLAEERELEKDLINELKLLDVNMHDLTRPSSD